jgi:hypothetical protein
VGKALVQKSGLMIDRSIHGQPVFDRSFFTEWALTHGFVHFRLQERPAVEIDVLNAALAAYFLSRDGYAFDGRRSLYSGSLVFRNLEPPPGTRGWAAPGVIWLGAANCDNREVFGHEIVHSLQFERGAAIYDLHRGFFRLNVLSFSTAVPALLNGWPATPAAWGGWRADWSWIRRGGPTPRSTGWASGWRSWSSGCGVEDALRPALPPGAGVEVSISGGLITLSGTVESEEVRRKLERLVGTATGVEAVRNQIQVAPSSARSALEVDQRLARQVEFELYLTRAMDLEAIEIQSQNGAVTLSGGIGSPTMTSS